MYNIKALKEEFYDVLMHNFVNYWETHSPDKEYGGFLCGFDRNGELFHEDKSVWQQGRSLWMFAKLYNEFGKKTEWLTIAKNGYDFLNRYCFDENGHMYFRITRDGKPLVNRRYYFSEAFAIMGYVELYLATYDPEVKERAVQLFQKFHYYYTTPGVFPPKIDPNTRKNQGHSIVMIMLNVCQHMRKIDENPLYDEIITACVDKIFSQFVKEDEKALFETVGPNGERVHSPEGRLINPGHSLETAWFIMSEAVHRGDKAMMEKAAEITLWSLERGWDREMEGLFYFVDAENKPVLSLEWDMKLFWTHCEGMVALLFCYLYRQDPVYMEWFIKLKNYCFEHYNDDPYPEWFGHLHRDGTPINHIKGSDWKGPFHNVRAFMLITQLLEKLENGERFVF